MKSILQEENKIKRPIVWITGAFVLGEVIAFRSVRTAFYLVMAGIPAAEFLLAGAGLPDAERRRKRCLLFLLLGTAFLGILRMREELMPAPLEVRLEAERVASGVQAAGTAEKLNRKGELCTAELRRAEVTVRGTRYRADRILVLLQPEQWEKLKPGMRLSVSGTLSLFERARNPGEFDARLYYRGLKIRYRMKAKRTEVIGREKRSPLDTLAESFRQSADRALHEICPAEDRGIFKSILLGDRSELPEETYRLYQEGGIAHILAVSGLHVSLVGLTVYRAVRGAGAGYGLSAAGAGMLLLIYGAVTGFGTSVFRAVFMAWCLFGAGILGRTYDLLSAMALSLLLLSADSPFLLFSGGLQLSYGAVTAVGIVTEREKKRQWERQKKGEKKEESRFCASFRTGFFLQLFLLPILLYHFFEVPLWSIFLNLLVIPLLPYGAGCGITGMILYMTASFFCSGEAVPEAIAFLSEGLMGPGHYCFSLYRTFCTLSLRLPFAKMGAGRPELWEIGFYYGALFLCLYGKGFKRKWFRELKAVCMALSLLLLLTVPVRGLTVWFLDVGQGDGVFLRTADTAILSDCGSRQMKNIGRNRLLPFLRSTGVRSLDYILVSHGDSDHINGIEYLLGETDFPVDFLILPEAGRGQEVYERLERLAEKRGTQTVYLHRGDQIREGKLLLSCLHPEPDDRTEEKNAHSLVFSAEYGEIRVLLTGDIEAAQEKKLCEENRISGRMDGTVCVLKAPHHGSGTSSTTVFLEQLQPDVSILSYGTGNAYGHPAPETLMRYRMADIPVRATAEEGAIRLFTDGRKAELTGFLGKAVDKKRQGGL